MLYDYNYCTMDEYKTAIEVVKNKFNNICDNAIKTADENADGKVLVKFRIEVRIKEIKPSWKEQHVSKAIRIISPFVQIVKVIKARGQKRKPVRVAENS